MELLLVVVVSIEAGKVFIGRLEWNFSFHSIYILL